MADSGPPVTVDQGWSAKERMRSSDESITLKFKRTSDSTSSNFFGPKKLLEVLSDVLLNFSYVIAARAVQQIQAMGQAVAAILEDGSVVTWGRAAYGSDSAAVRIS